jgi:Clostripain family.
MARSRLMTTLAAAGASVVALAGLTACVGGPSSPIGGPLVAPDSWTIMTYSIADTNLEPAMLEDIEELGQVGTRPGLNLVALVDRAEGYTDTSVLGLPDWTGAKLLEIGRGTATELYDYGPLNTGDPATLQAFIRESIRAYPAANYGLVISDHGASWPGIGDDESHNHDTLTLSELEQAISGAIAETGVDGLDLLGFDACLMATYEVATTMAPYADILVASQELEPGHGWDYRSFEAAFRGASPSELGSAIVDGFEAQAISYGTSIDITLSVVDLANFGVVDTALREFAQAMTDRVRDVAPAVGRNLAETLGFGTHPNPAYDRHMKDLGILAGEISVDAVDVADEAEAVVRAVNDVVLDNVVGQATRGATGLSIYFPPNGQFYNRDYTAVAEDTGWVDFLTTYYEAGGAIDPGDLPSFVTNDALVEFDNGGVWVGGTFGDGAEENIAEVVLYYGILRDDGTIDYLGDKSGYVSDDGSNRASAFYNLGYLSLSDGEDSALAYLGYSQDRGSGSATVSVPLDYYAPDTGDRTEALLELSLDAATGNIVSETYYGYVPESDQWGQLTADPRGEIIPFIERFSPDTQEFSWVPTTDTGLYADLSRLQYLVDPLPSGLRLVLELWVYDFGGNGDYVSAVITVP